MHSIIFYFFILILNQLLREYTYIIYKNQSNMPTIGGHNKSHQILIQLGVITKAIKYGDNCWQIHNTSMSGLIVHFQNVFHHILFFYSNFKSTIERIYIYHLSKTIKIPYHTIPYHTIPYRMCMVRLILTTGCSAYCIIRVLPIGKWVR